MIEEGAIQKATLIWNNIHGRTRNNAQIGVISRYTVTATRNLQMLPYSRKITRPRALFYPLHIIWDARTRYFETKRQNSEPKVLYIY